MYPLTFHLLILPHLLNTCRLGKRTPLSFPRSTSTSFTELGTSTSPRQSTDAHTAPGSDTGTCPGVRAGALRVWPLTGRPWVLWDSELRRWQLPRGQSGLPACLASTHHKPHTPRGETAPLVPPPGVGGVFRIRLPCPAGGWGLGAKHAVPVPRLTSDPTAAAVPGSCSLPHPAPSARTLTVGVRHLHHDGLPFSQF